MSDMGNFELGVWDLSAAAKRIVRERLGVRPACCTLDYQIYDVQIGIIYS